MFDDDKSKQKPVNCSIDRGSPMLRILVCDDDSSFAEKLQTQIEIILKKDSTKVKIHTYNSLETIGDPILRSCDILRQINEIAFLPFRDDDFSLCA